MSVYTSVSDDEMRQLLTRYNLGEFQSLQGIATTQIYTHIEDKDLEAYHRKFFKQ